MISSRGVIESFFFLGGRDEKSFKFVSHLYVTAIRYAFKYIIVKKKKSRPRSDSHSTDSEDRDREEYSIYTDFWEKLCADRHKG